MKKTSHILTWLALLVMFSVCALALTDAIPVGDFSTSGLDGWEEKSFNGHTMYQLTPLDGKTVLAADSHDSASGLYRKQRVDIREYPYLNWRWRIESRLAVTDETTKAGDDYAVRVYVVVDGGIFFWRTKAISYVWAEASARGDVWPNAFAGKSAMMLALRDRRDNLSTWYTEKRNIYQDLQQLFGRDFKRIDAVAIMTDTDNSHGEAKAYYGDIYFSRE